MKRLFIASAAVLMLMMGTTAFAAAPAKVLVLPFDAIGESAKPWIANALQQNLSAELSRLSSVQQVTGERPVANVDAALKAAADAKADYVVFGSYQTVENDLRLTGQVVDVAKKEPVAGLKATGSLRDLFGLEDVIANQVKRSLPQPVAQAGPDMLKQPPAAGEAEPQPEEPAPAVGMNERVRELEEQIDRAIDRLKYATPDYDDYGYYGGTYGYSSFYGPYYPTYYFPSPYYVIRPGYHHRLHTGNRQRAVRHFNGRPIGATMRMGSWSGGRPISAGTGRTNVGAGVGGGRRAR